MKYVLLTIERCNDCPLVKHDEFSETKCTVQADKTVYSDAVDANCPLPDVEEEEHDS